MEEIVTRRLKHSVENPKGAFGTLPNIIFADGGIAQIRAIKRALGQYNLETIPVFGMVKDDKHRTKTVIDENGNDLLNSNNIVLNFITMLQDEVHNTAIEYNRKLSEKSMTKSKLDEISGIGEKKRQELLKKFGSVEGIKKADFVEIASIKGINLELAKKIKKKLDE